MSREATAPPRTVAQRLLGDHPTAWLFVAPAVVVIVGLAIIPIGWSVVLSLKSADLIRPAQWIGLKNYDVLVSDPALGDAIRHTIVYTVLFVPISTGLGLLLAMALNRKIRLIGIYRTAFLAPFIASVAAQGVLFSFIFDQRFGVANALLDQARAADAGLPRRSEPGDLRDRADRDLGRDRVPAGDLPCRSAGRAARVDRRRFGRRRSRLGDPAPRDPAAAVAGHRLPPGLADAALAAAVRPRLRDHQGRPDRIDGGGRLLHLQPGVPPSSTPATPRRSRSSSPLP